MTWERSIQLGLESKGSFGPVQTLELDHWKRTSHLLLFHFNQHHPANTHHNETIR